MQTEQPTPPSSGKPRLKLHPFTLLLSLAVMGTGLGVSYVSHTHENFLWISNGVGRFFGAVLACATIALVVYLIAKRSSRAFNIAMSTLLTLSIVSNGVSILNHRRAAAAAEAERTVQSLDAARQELAESVRKNRDQPDAAARNAQDVAGITDTIENRAANLTGDGAVVMRVGAAVIKSVTAVASKVGEASDRFAQLGGIDPVSLKSPRDIIDRLALLDDLAAKNKALADGIRAMPEEYRLGLIKAGFDKGKAGLHSDEFAKGANIPRQINSTRLRDASIAANREYLALLKDLWGKWAVQDDQLVLDDDAAIQKLRAALERIEAAEKAESDAANANVDAAAASPSRPK